jgi:murein DD-endopeptidase MepM/ murein hydrolase activator NlpD
MADTNQLLQGISSSAYSLGKSLPKKKVARDTSVFSNVVDNIKSSSNSSGSTSLGPITTQYGGSTNYEKFHPGIDVAAPKGTELKPYTGGKVIDLRTGQLQDPSKPSFGNYVIIEDEQGNKHRYSHLEKSFVKVGQQVTPDMAIGEVGNSGSTYSAHGGDGSHLDYRIKNAYGKYIDPSIYLNRQ